MPYICHIHNGLYVTSPEIEGCQDSYCLQLARTEVPAKGVHIAGFAGSDATKISRHDSRTFHRDMYAYKEAVNQGVQPDQITAKAAETALKEAEAVA